MANDVRSAAARIHRFWNRMTLWWWLRGTHQHKKHTVVLGTILAQTNETFRTLFRVNSRNNADDFLRDLGVSHASL